MNFDQLAYVERFGRWQWLKMPVALSGGSELYALASGIDWAHVVPLLGLGITVIGTAAAGIVRCWKLNQIEVREKQRESDFRISEMIRKGGLDGKVGP